MTTISLIRRLFICLIPALIGTAIIQARSLHAAPLHAMAAAEAPIDGMTQIVSGSGHTCGLISNGRVKCWGWNVWGQLGDGTNTNRSTPVDVVGLTSGVNQIAAGELHTCALTSGGAVKCWGLNTDLQLGNSTVVTAIATPVDVEGLGSGVVAIAASRLHTCALMSGGTVKCWGRPFGSYSEEPPSATPTEVPELSGAKAIAVGYGFACALTSTNGAQCWGGNINGELGDGSFEDYYSPVNVEGLTSGVSMIAAGPSHACAVTTSGSLKCWGANHLGQLGDGTTISRPTPVDVVGMSSGVTAVTAGGSVAGAHTCALANGVVKCWGYNADGQLGDGSTTQRLTPVQVIGLSGAAGSSAAGGDHTCALTVSGAVNCWGDNYYGQLGDGTGDNQHQPVDVVGLSSGIKTASTGADFSCAVTNGGGVKCWGAILGGPTQESTAKLTPVDITGFSSPVSTISSGASHVCALTSAGAVQCWGYNSSGALGDNSNTNRSTPVTVVGLGSGVRAIAAGGYHTCALTDGGGVKCWGDNADGQLGDESTTQRFTPVDVFDLTSGVSAITAGESHTCAVTSSGGAMCWGDNYFGQLSGTITSTHTVPKAVVGLSSGVRAIAAGGYHTCALTDGGGVKCWGDNAYGQLGDGTTTTQLEPVDVTGLSSGVIAIAAGSLHICALTTDGGVKCWGDNRFGQLGDGTTTERYTPVNVLGLTSGVSAITTGNGFTCAVTSVGAVKCWGQNYAGQLGNGSAWRTLPVDVLAPCFPLTLLHSGSGHTLTATPDRSSTCPAGSYFSTSLVTLNAVPAQGWRVEGWRGTSNNASTDNTNTLIMPAAPHTAHVTYAKLSETTLSPGADAYEEDDSCELATTIMADGTPQTHNFHQLGDVDWVRFDTGGGNYRVEVVVPQGSPADVIVESFDSCEKAPVDRFAATFAPGARFDLPAPTSGMVYLRLTNTDATTAGPHVEYHLSVRRLDVAGGSGALILVAGRLKSNDEVQANIDNVTQAVYNLHRANGYSDAQILYLATNPALPGYDLPATVANLQQAILEWAPAHVGRDRLLTIYLMDHGDVDKFFLDALNEQELTPQQLNGWLDELEAAVPDIKITVIIEACNSGSFIEGAQTISKPGRLVIASTSAASLAFASPTGAYFSDYLLLGLRQGYNLLNSYRAAYATTRELTNLLQEPWLDSNGNGIANEPEDVTLASRHQGGITAPIIDESWPPYIVSATGPSEIVNNRGTIEAVVRDNKAVRRVWAVIYPPSYQPPASNLELVPDILPTIVLHKVEGESYRGEYPGFDERGRYRIAIYAEDDDGLVSQPLVINGPNSGQLYMPYLQRDGTQ